MSQVRTVIKAFNDAHTNYALRCRWREENRWRAAESLRKAQLRVECALETRDGRQRVAEVLMALDRGQVVGPNFLGKPAEDGYTRKPCMQRPPTPRSLLQTRAGGGGAAGHKSEGAMSENGRTFSLGKLSALVSNRGGSGARDSKSGRGLGACRGEDARGVAPYDNLTARIFPSNLKELWLHGLT